jgi:recombination protein RecT
MYWSKEKMIAHADRYSPAFSRNATTGRYPKVSFADYEDGNYPKGDEWKYSSFWYKDFDGMAMKTMIRQILTKWGRLSIEMSNAIEQDTQNEAQGVDYGADLTTAALPEPTPIGGEPDAQPTQESAEPEVVALDDL